MIPFQCDLIHLSNLQRSDPKLNPEDSIILIFVFRSTLEYFQGISEKKVSSVSNVIRTISNIFKNIVLTSPLPEMGPFFLKCSSGVFMAILSLDNSLYKTGSISACPLFYAHSLLSEPQSFKSIILTNSSLISTLKYPMTQFFLLCRRSNTFLKCPVFVV